MMMASSHPNLNQPSSLRICITSRLLYILLILLPYNYTHLKCVLLFKKSLEAEIANIFIFINTVLMQVFTKKYVSLNIDKQEQGKFMMGINIRKVFCFIL